MARDGSYYYNPTTNCSQWEQPVQELYRQPKMESQNGGAAPSRRDMKWERDNYSATSRTARGKCSRSPVQTMWSWQAKQDYDAYIDEIHTRVSDALEQVERDGNYIEELQIKLDEALRQADEVREDYV